MHCKCFAVSSQASRRIAWHRAFFQRLKEVARIQHLVVKHQLWENHWLRMFMYLSSNFVTRKQPYRPPNPEKLKDAKKWLKRDFQGPGESDSKVTQKWRKRSKMSLLSRFWATFESLSPGPRKSLLSHFFISLNFSGFGGLWGYFWVTTVISYSTCRAGQMGQTHMGPDRSQLDFRWLTLSGYTLYLSKHMISFHTAHHRTASGWQVHAPTA